MPDFRAYVRANLRLDVDGAREIEIVEELALELEEHYTRALHDGLSREDAWELMVSHPPDWRQIARDIHEVVKGDDAAAYEARENTWARVYETVRLALRLPRRNPGFAITAILAIALGIGPNTAMFSAIYSIFFAPPPWADSGELVVFWGRTSRPPGAFRGTVDGTDLSRVHISPREYEGFKAQSAAFRGFAAAMQERVTLDDGSERPESVWIQSVTPGWLSMIGAKLQMGRDFLPEEGLEGNQHKAVISSRLWKTRFGGDPQIIGKQILVDGENCTVVGVTAPGSFDHYTELLWTALAVRSAKLRPGDDVLTVIGQLKRGVGLEQAQAEIGGIVSRLAIQYGNADASWSVNLEPYRNDWLTKRARSNLWLLMCAAGFVLLVACVNVANLLVAHGATREKDMAVRASLGATRWQLFGQALADTLVLFAFGGMLGAGLGWAVLRIFLTMLPPGALPPQSDIAMNIPALLFAGTTALVTGLIFGSVPGWRAARVDVDKRLKQGGGTGTPRRRHRLARMLVIIECSLTITLLAGAGLAIHTLWTRSHLDLGIQTDHILTFELQLPRSRQAKPEQAASFYNALIEKIDALPGVKSAAALNTWGLLREPGLLPFALGRKTSDIPKLPRAAVRVATPGFFQTFGVRVVSGRPFADTGGAGSEPVVMVNEKFMHAYLADDGVSAREVSIPAFPFGPFRIVGVYRDVQNAEQLGQPNLPEFCLPFGQLPQAYAIVAVRTAGEPDGIVKAVAGVVRSMSPGLPMGKVATLDEMVRERLGFDRFEAALYGAFAALALILAVVGIHGVMAFIVAQQTREIGLRIALGADPSAIRRAVLREGMGLAATGLAIGAGFAWYGGRLMQATLYGTRDLDGATLLTVAGVLLAAAALGCGIPARRAAAVDPMTALRSE